jgi:hypothetical protein
VAQKSISESEYLTLFFYEKDPLIFGWEVKEDGFAYIQKKNIVVGGKVRLRQLRLKKGTCYRGNVRWFAPNLDCFASDFDKIVESTENYGPEMEWKWQLGSSKILGSAGLIGNQNYPQSGYIVDLPVNQTAALDILTYLDKNNWIDENTR